MTYTLLLTERKFMWRSTHSKYPLNQVNKTLLCNFIEITPRHGCSPINLLHIFRTPFLKNTSGRLLLDLPHCYTHFSKIRVGVASWSQDLSYIYYSLQLYLYYNNEWENLQDTPNSQYNCQYLTNIAK